MVTSHNNAELAAFTETKDQIKWGEYELVIDYTVEKNSYSIIKEKGLKRLLMCHPLYHNYSTPPPLKYPCIVGTSDAHCQYLSERLGVPVRELPYGYELPDKDVPERDNKGYLLYIGRIAKAKGVHEFLSLCKKNRFDAVIAGDDKNVEEGYVFNILERCEGLNIRYMGCIDESVKMKLLSEAQALVIPYLSDFDAFVCSTLSIATAMKIPTIALNKGAVKEFINKGVNGFYVDTLEQLYSFDFNKIDGLTFDYNYKPKYARIEELITAAISDPW